MMGRWRRLPAWVPDAVLAGAVAVFDVVGTVYAAFPGHPLRQLDLPGYVLLAATAAPLAVRRRWPIAVFATTLALALVYFGLGYPNGMEPTPVIIALYSVATVESRARSLACAVTGIVSLVVVRVTLANAGWSNPQVIAGVSLLAAALFLGWAVASSRAYVAEIKDRAERAERTREEEARRRVDAERLRIARELHDVVAHSIATINVQARAAAQLLPERTEEAGRSLAAIKTASKEALREMRGILDVLRQADEADPTAPAPGLDLLDVLMSTASKAGVGTELSVTGEPHRLPASIDLAAYRIVQESITNVLRHAGRASASILIAYEDHELIIEVNDDGRGATTAGDGDSSGPGHGITGMKERAVSVGGTLEAGPRPERGFRVRAWLPTPEEP
jgi:signal transduction histidine kinase